MPAQLSLESVVCPSNGTDNNHKLADVSNISISEFLVNKPAGSLGTRSHDCGSDPFIQYTKEVPLNENGLNNFKEIEN